MIGGPGSLMAAGGVVHLRAYTRSRVGRTEHVRAHGRADPLGVGNPSSAFRESRDIENALAVMVDMA
jgi:hypothetical protein